MKKINLLRVILLPLLAVLLVSCSDNDDANEHGYFKPDKRQHRTNTIYSLDSKGLLGDVKKIEIVGYANSTWNKEENQIEKRDSTSLTTYIFNDKGYLIENITRFIPLGGQEEASTDYNQYSYDEKDRLKSQIYSLSYGGYRETVYIYEDEKIQIIVDVYDGTELNNLTFTRRTIRTYKDYENYETISTDFFMNTKSSNVSDSNRDIKESSDAIEEVYKKDQKGNIVEKYILNSTTNKNGITSTTITNHSECKITYHDGTESEIVSEDIVGENERYNAIKISNTEQLNGNIKSYTRIDCTDSEISDLNDYEQYIHSKTQIDYDKDGYRTQITVYEMYSATKIYFEETYEVDKSKDRITELITKIYIDSDITYRKESIKYDDANSKAEILTYIYFEGQEIPSENDYVTKEVCPLSKNGKVNDYIKDHYTVAYNTTRLSATNRLASSNANVEKYPYRKETLVKKQDQHNNLTESYFLVEIFNRITGNLEKTNYADYIKYIYTYY